MVKIEKEQKYLLESAKTIIQLNKRLQTFGLCFHAINQKNKVDIKNLKHKLITFSINKFMQASNTNTVYPEIENLRSKVHIVIILYNLYDLLINILI